MAATIKASINEINVIGDLAKAQPSSGPAQYQSVPGLPDIVPEEKIPSSGEVGASEDFADINSQVEDVPIFDPDGNQDSYHAFTKLFDEVIDAADLAEKAELLMVAVNDLSNEGIHDYISQKATDVLDDLSRELLIIEKEIDKPNRDGHSADNG
jgi:hypothetical protein